MLHVLRVQAHAGGGFASAQRLAPAADEATARAALDEARRTLSAVREAPAVLGVADVGRLCGALAFAVNQRLAHSSLPRMVKVVATLAIGGAAGLVYLMVAVALHLALGR